AAYDCVSLLQLQLLSSLSICCAPACIEHLSQSCDVCSWRLICLFDQDLLEVIVKFDCLYY
uniref:Uncharacterized protein n=1 Tax=Oryza brachyantha TaxID=4533 RepID=J3N2S4_ORYBR